MIKDNSKKAVCISSQSMVWTTDSYNFGQGLRKEEKKHRFSKQHADMILAQQLIMEKDKKVDSICTFVP